MINAWEALQGLAFMATFGVLTRLACGGGKRTPTKPASAPQAASQAVLLPTPRNAPEEEEHGSIPIG